MRIANLLPGGLRGAGYEIPQGIVGDGFQTEIVETSAAPFPSSQLDLLLTEVSYVEAGIRARDEGFDAVFVNTVGDYGLDALRSALEVPVVGAGQATLHVASTLGRRFSIVTVWPVGLRYLYERLVFANGLEGRCASIRHVASPEELPLKDGADRRLILEMRDGESSIVERVEREVRAAIEEDGAHAVVLGCGCMGPIAPTLAARVPEPVLDPLLTGYTCIEMLLRLGLSQSPAAYPHTPHHGHFAVGRIGSAGTHCPVCVT